MQKTNLKSTVVGAKTVKPMFMPKGGIKIVHKE